MPRPIPGTTPASPTCRPTTDKTVLKGGALAYLDGYVYAFLGNGSNQFWRYNVADNILDPA